MAEPQAKLMDADETLSPVDLPGSTFIGGRPLGWATAVIATAAAFLLLTNALTIDGWAKELPPSAVTERLTTLTGRWLALTDAVGLGATRALVHGQWKRAEAARFERDSGRD